ncbi:MAG: hypothetical protein K0Q49_1742 [Haloplasmataceae bacterium]|jgi:hypothetical protein|nr:hypothetical protein [Haloplasmataceae bacterium]
MFKKIKNKKIFSIFILVALTWNVLMRFTESQPLGWMFFGTWFLIPGLIGIYFRIDFDISKKFITEGELVSLEKVIDDNGTSYRPIYKYIYNNEERSYLSPASSFFFKKTKKVGDKEVILILIKNPKRVRMKRYLLLEYCIYIFLFIFGLFFIMKSLNMMG